MLPTVLRKIVLRFQPGTGQFLVTRPARARWRDSIGGNVSAHHRVSCPVHAGARHAGDLVDHHGLYGTGCRRRAPDTGHRSLNPNVTPPGLRPGAREGEPQARRCRSRVSVPSSAVERGPGRSARPVGRRHAGNLVDHHGAARNRRSPSPSCTGHRSLNLNVTPPGLRPGAREGEPQARRCRSRVSVPSSVVGRGAGRRLDPSGAAMRKLLVLANALQLRLTRRPLWPQAATRRGRRQGAVVDGGTPALISARFAVDWGVTCRGLAAGLRLFSLTRTRRSRGVLWPGHADLVIELGWRRVRLAFVRTGGGDD